MSIGVIEGGKYMRLLMAGESHGNAQCAILEGFPKGVKIETDYINKELARRQKGYGRGARMNIETDRISFLSGLRAGMTLGSPIAMTVKNRDQTIFSDRSDALEPLSVPRPAHADLAGSLKYHQRDMRNILERSSARETVMRVCAGGICKQFLAQFDISIASFVSSLGSMSSSVVPGSVAEIIKKTALSKIGGVDKNFEKKSIALIDKAKRQGDTLGGIIEIWADHVPPGLGSPMHYDQRLDARLAGALMSIPAVKGVEIGLGFEYARQRGSKTHDALFPGGVRRSVKRKTNNAGGIEGGMSNGQTLVARIAMKPIATLGRPLDSVDLAGGKKKKAPCVRSDVCAVGACGVIAESMMALVLTECFLGKFGCDAREEIKRNYQNYIRMIAR